MKKYLFYIPLIIFSLWNVQKANAQIQIFYEDFASLSGNTYQNDSTSIKSGTSGYGLNYSWDYSNDNNGIGQLNFGTVNYNGTDAALMDNGADNGTYVQNYLDLTIDMSSVANKKIKLNFYYSDYADESDAGDGVWIRGSNTDTSWIQIYDLDPVNKSDGNWNYVQNIDIDAALSGAGQSYTSTFQIRFGQYDNYGYNTDGIAFDDIELTRVPDNDIKLENILVSNFSTCGSNAYPLKVVVRNNGLSTQSNITVNLRIYGQKDSSITRTATNSVQYDQTDTLDFGTIDTRTAGLYEFVANVTIPVDSDMSNNERTENYTIETPKVSPIDIKSNFNSYSWYKNRFTVYPSYLQSSMTYVNERASITTFRIDSVPENTALAFDYKINSWDASWNTVDSLGTNDIIKVYIAEDFNGAYTELYYIDESRDKYNSGNYSSIPSINLANYQGKDVVIKIELQNGASADETNAVNMYLDNLYVGPADVQVFSINYSYDATCGTPAMAVSLDVRNSTSVDAVNVPVYFEFTPANGIEVKDSVTVASVPANSTVTVNLSKTYDAGAPDIYRLSAYTKYTNDPNTGNDLRNESFTINALESLPYRPFTDNTFNTWSTNNTTGTVATNWLYYGESADMSSPKIGTIVKGAELSFKYKLANGAGGYYLYDGDTIHVLVSSDCGTNWTNLYSITHSNSQNTNLWQYVSNIDLSAYDGQNIRLKYEVLKNDSAGSIQISFDDIEVQASGDAMVSAVKFPHYKSNVAICGTISDSAMVIVKNNGVNTIDTIPVELGIMFGATSNDTVKLSRNVYNLAAGYSDTIYISGFSTIQDGNYYLYAKTNLNDDLDGSNDKFGNTTLTVQNLHALPWNYDGNSLPTDWQYSKHQNNTGNSIYTDYLSQGDSAYFIPQKFGTIQKGDSLRLGFRANNLDKGGSFLNYNLRARDSILVQVSEDCGVNFMNLAVITDYQRSNSAYIDTAWALDAYAGKDIVMRILTIKGNEIGTLITLFDYFKITIPQPDIKLNSVYVNDGKDNDVCGNATDPVYAVISNQSTYDALTNFDVIVYIKDANNNTLDTLMTNYSATLNPGKTDTVMVGNFNSELPESYSINGEIDLTGDINLNNNTSTRSYKIWDKFDAKGYTQDFESNIDGWHFERKSSWSWSGSSWAMQAGTLAADDTATFYSPKLGTIKQGYSLQFDYMFTGDFLVGDKIEVYITDNCGASYALLGTISNPDNLSGFATSNVTEQMSLANYQNKDVYFKFVVSNINGNAFTAYIDNVKIIRTDLAVIGIVNNLADFEYTNNLGSFIPSNSSQGIVRYETCGNASEDVYAIVENKGDNKISTFTLNFAVSGKIDSTYSTINSSRALESGDRALIKLGTINTQTQGLVDMKITANTTDDGDATNDTLGFSVTTQETYDTPFSAFNSPNFNEKYYWKYDYDTIASTQHMHLSSPTLYTDQLTEGQEAYAVSPKLNIPNNGGLEFYYYVKNSIEGHIIHDEAIEIQISTACSPTWTTLKRVDVTTNDTSSNDVQFVDLSAYASQQVRIKFLATKGFSNGTFYATFSNIRVTNYPKASIQLEADGEPFSGSNFTFCQDTTLSLTLNQSYNTISWYKIDLADTSNTSNFVANTSISTPVTNKSYQYYAALKQFNYITYSDTITVNAKAIPGKPIVPIGADAVVSDVEAQYSINPVKGANYYVWSINAGSIVGNDTSAIVYWTSGYRGTAEITVKAQNECGVGSSSSPLVVRVEYLGTGIAQANDFSWSVYPNPTSDQFSIDFGSGDFAGLILNIYNASGKRVLARKIDNVKMNINLSQYANGIYQIVVIKDNKLYRTNIMIK